MWVIVANLTIQENRNNRISELLGENSNNSFISSYSSKYRTTNMLEYAKFFKKESSAYKIIEEFNNTDVVLKSKFQSKFFYISDYILSVKKISREQWYKIIELELSKLEYKYQKQKSKILKKRDSF